MYLDRFSIKIKLFFVFFLILVYAAFLAFNVIDEYYRNLQVALKINKITQVSTLASKLVHELQKERGLTAGYLASGKQKFVTELREQRQATDSKVNELKNLLTKIQIEKVKELKELNIISKLSFIKQLREMIDNNQITALETISELTSLIKFFIQINRINMDNSLELPELYTQTKVLYTFTQIKENYGQLRANINRIATADSVDYNGYQNVSRLYYNINLLKNEFDIYAMEKYLVYWENLNKQEAFEKVSKTIEKVLQNFGKKGLSISPIEWFQNATTYIDDLAVIEGDLLTDNYNLTQQFEDKNYNSFLIYTIITLVFFVLITWISIFIISNITKNIAIATNYIINLMQGKF